MKIASRSTIGAVFIIRKNNKTQTFVHTGIIKKSLNG